MIKDSKTSLVPTQKDSIIPAIELNYPGRVDTSRAEWKKFEQTIDLAYDTWRKGGSYLNIMLHPSTARKLANIKDAYEFDEDEEFLLAETQRMISERLNGTNLRIDPFITVSEMDDATPEILGIINHKFKSPDVDGPYVQVGPFSKANGGLCPRVDLGIDDILEMQLLPVSGIVDVDVN